VRLGICPRYRHFVAKILGVQKGIVFANRMNWCAWESVQDIDILWPRS
jgi:hypothetical protein